MIMKSTRAKEARRKKKPDMITGTAEAYKLFHDGSLCFADMQENGIRIDTHLCRYNYKKLGEDIKDLESKISLDKIILSWKREYGDKFNLDSNKQLADILFNKKDYIPVKFTEKGNPSADQEALEMLNIPFVKNLIRIRKIKKIRNTYIAGLLRETVNGILHPFFNLHTAATFRSSSSEPNFQNMPIRDPEWSELIRSVIIPRKDSYFVESDYESIEVQASTWNHQDPAMLKYLFDSNSDMHKDMAIQIYLLDQFDKKTGDKTLRKGAKNGFVFPQFYGDYYANNAVSLWDWAGLSGTRPKGGVELSTGIKIGDHLKNKGIKTYAKFEKYLKEIEKDFWYNRFKGYRQWKEDKIKEYEKNGFIKTLTGFTCQGYMDNKQVTNYPVQSIAFHALLWSAINVNKLLKRNNMNSMLIGQVHDSLVADVPKEEMNDYKNICKQVMCHDIKKHWQWINTPVGISIEASDKSWFHKAEIESYRGE